MREKLRHELLTIMVKSSIIRKLSRDDVNTDYAKILLDRFSTLERDITSLRSTVVYLDEITDLLYTAMKYRLAEDISTTESYDIINIFLMLYLMALLLEDIDEKTGETMTDPMDIVFAFTENTHEWYEVLENLFNKYGREIVEDFLMDMLLDISPILTNMIKREVNDLNYVIPMELVLATDKPYLTLLYV